MARMTSRARGTGQHWLGQHSAAFSLATYVPLLDEDLGGPLVPVASSGGVAIAADV